MADSKNKNKVKQLTQKVNDLKNEERVLNMMLTEIRAEINKYNVEQLHLKSQAAPMDSTDSEAEDPPHTQKSVHEILQEMDDVMLVNKKRLELEKLNKSIPRTEEEEEESDGG